MFASLAMVIVGVIEALIGLRIVLLLMGANPASPFVAWIYSWSSPLVAPFSGIFGQQSATATGPGIAAQSVFDWTGVIAFVVYALIGWIISRAVAPRMYHHGV